MCGEKIYYAEKTIEATRLEIGVRESNWLQFIRYEDIFGSFVMVQMWSGS